MNQPPTPEQQQQRDERLNDMVEAELTEQQVREALRDDPAMAEVILTMRAQRQQLRDLADPALTAGDAEAIMPDVQAYNETRLARPMLFDNPAIDNRKALGSYRRKRRRQQMQRRLARLAAAAVLMLGVGVGGWGIWLAAQPLFQSNSSQLARDAEPATPSNEQPASADAKDSTALASGGTAGGNEIHHHLPPLAHTAQESSPESTTGANPTVATASGDNQPLTSSVAIVLQMSSSDRTQSRHSDHRRPERDGAVGDAGGESAAQQPLTAVINAIDESSALVRNFSFEEARWLEAQWRQQLNRTEQPRVARMQADLDQLQSSGDRQAYRKKLAELARHSEQQRHALDRLADQLPVSEPAHRPPHESSGVIAGNPQLEPAYNLQLVMSSAGATYTLAVPLGQIDDLLETLHTGVSPATVALIPFETDEADETATPPSGEPERVVSPREAGDVSWLLGMQRLRQQLQQWRDLPESTIVHIPMMIEQRPR